MHHAETTREFFARWSMSYDEMCASFRETFSAGCVWDQRPIACTNGPDRAVRFLALAHRAMGLATIDVELVSIAVAGETVHTERIDHLRTARGRTIVSAPVAGVLTYRGSELVHWREYFDASTLALKSAVGLASPRSRRRQRAATGVLPDRMTGSSSPTFWASEHWSSGAS
ncbi:MAG TPA: limonene-1,2-epoxide hydrolase family protein [Mycobacteriales bacterium]|jgi:limonene-1,2-epoxide hydrolase|nr:limonene-1,2-epoxide hydrolase family protein [Mycobacteriales bacterium]